MGVHALHPPSRVEDGFTMPRDEQPFAFCNQFSDPSAKRPSSTE
jgi:hypothetical protein